MRREVTRFIKLFSRVVFIITRYSHFDQIRAVDSGAKTLSHLQDLSDPFRQFPRVVPHACVNNSQSFLKDVWTVICLNDPDFNDIARELFFNGQWESWLTDHIVRAMINYPAAVLLGLNQRHVKSEALRYLLIPSPQISAPTSGRTA